MATGPTRLEFPAVRQRLILELAQGEKTQRALASDYGVVQSAIAEFKGRHLEEVESRAERLADEWAGLWIADKRNRVIEAQADVDAINEALQSTKDAQMFRTKLAIMRQVAEELGQLKDVVEVQGRLTYVVEGVDVADLS